MSHCSRSVLCRCPTHRNGERMIAQTGAGKQGSLPYNRLRFRRFAVATIASEKCLWENSAHQNRTNV
jgi:hypothetical protein